jgi:hypothetical protein
MVGVTVNGSDVRFNSHNAFEASTNVQRHRNDDESTWSDRSTSTVVVLGKTPTNYSLISA